MKTERRHELQTNSLASSLEEGIEKVRPYVNHILLGLGVGIVLLLAIAFFRSQARAKQASAWEAFFLATTPSETSAENEQDRLRRVVKDFGDTTMADWARLSIGDESLNMASQLIATNKSESRKNLNAAIGEYRPLADSSKVPQVRHIANYNLGISYEMLGEVDKAVESYRRVEGTLSKLAKDRVAALESNQEVKDFYQWYATAEPATQDITGGAQPGQTPPFSVDDPRVSPFGDAPGGKPGDGDLPPVELFPKDANKQPAGNPGDVKLPGLGNDLPTTPTTNPDVPADPAAAPDPAEKPDAEKPDAEADPAKEAPADETPADETPADETPADEKPSSAAPADSPPGEAAKPAEPTQPAESESPAEAGSNNDAAAEAKPE